MTEDGRRWGEVKSDVTIQGWLMAYDLEGFTVGLLKMTMRNG